MTNQEKLLSYSLAILKEGDFHEELAPAITNYAEFLFSLTEINHQTEPHRTHINTDNGSAIGTFWAAQCVKEIFRTQRFVQGLHAAIKDIKKAQKNKTIHILYAGTGPFAALALPIMATHSPVDVQFTLLEINPESYTRLLYVLEKLNFSSFVYKTALADASKWETKKQHFDIVLSETMNRALIKEPQVSIMLNIASQAKNSSTVFIPEEIRVDVVAKSLHGRQKKTIANLISFNKEYMFDLVKRSTNNEWDFEEIEITFNPNDKLYLETEITVYRSHRLTGNDCSLNFSEPIKIGGNNKASRLSFRYSTASKPRFEYRLIDKD